MPQYWKVLDNDNRSCHGGDATWMPGEWMPAIEGELIPCENGYHLCRRQDLLLWLGKVIWEAEVDGDVVEADDKIVARSARIMRRLDAWNERTARLFAADCAEHVLHLFERGVPNDARPRRAIEVARHYANDEATDAARDAARAAAWAAAWAAAGAAAGDAAWDAAGAAAWAAARDAARAAAWAAAGAAARDAAWAAARDAAWAAAGAAAGAAACRWQTERLFAYLYPVP